jgi:hypothetical protein
MTENDGNSTTKAVRTTTRPVISEFYKRERERKSGAGFEAELLNVVRKLRDSQKLEVYFCAERLAIAKINTCLQRRKVAADKHFQRFLGKLNIGQTPPMA